MMNQLLFCYCKSINSINLFYLLLFLFYHLQMMTRPTLEEFNSMSGGN